MAERNPSKQSKPKISERLIGFVVAPFYGLTIARKLMLGYSVLLLLLVGISVFALFYLSHLNKINRSVLETDLPILNLSGKMEDVIFEQERYVQRYLILKSPEYLRDFWDKENEFNQLTEQLRALPDHRAYPISQIVNLQLEYNYILSEAIGWIEDPESPISKAFEKNIKTQQEKIIGAIQKLQKQANWEQKQKTGLTATIGRIAFKVAGILCGLGLLFSLIAACRS